MGLELNGELLAVTTEHVNGGVSAAGKAYDAFERITLTVFDGKAYEVAVGRDFEHARLNELRDLIGKGLRPMVRVGVFASSKGFLTATTCIDVRVPAAVAAHKG